MSEEIKLVKTNEEPIEKPKEIDEKKVNELNEKLKAAEEEFTNKKFLFEVDEKSANDLLSFIENGIKWKGRECVGVVELNKVFKEAYGVMLKTKQKGLMLNNVPVEALAFFIQSYESKGYEQAKIMEPWIEPLTKIIHEAKKMRDNMDEIKKELIAAEEGIDYEEEAKKMIAADIEMKKKAQKIEMENKEK